ncbi:MAG: hypothetical protein ACI4WS_01080 [Oscillospiraceae bacterium]
MRVRLLLYWLAQWTWGVVQNLCGLVVFLLNIRREHRFYHGAVVTSWDNPGYSTGLGMFIFMSDSISAEDYPRTLVHEYGHTVQSALLGVFFLPAVGLPSVLWAAIPALKRFRREKRVSYYWFYPERWANFLGERVTKSQSMGQKLIDV